MLNSTGSGKLTPSRIPASEFVNGSALVDVQYNKSEAFSIVAEPVPSAHQLEKRAAGAEQKKPGPASKDEIAKTSSEQGAKAGSFEINGISLVETLKSTTVTIHIPGLTAASKLQFNARSVAAAGKKWIVLSISPAVSKVVEPVRFDSASIGKVVIEQNKKNNGSVLIKIENLKSAKFKTQKNDKSLAITLAH
jgi:hypothetical protein